MYILKDCRNVFLKWEELWVHVKSAEKGFIKCGKIEVLVKNAERDSKSGKIAGACED